MKRLSQRIEEKLVINKDFKEHIYTPNTWDDLREIIENRYDKLGHGTIQEPIDFNDIDVSGMKTFSDSNSNGVFEGTKFEYIDVSRWDVSNIKNMNDMFYNCVNLISVGDLSEWVVSNVENMAWMFNECYWLKSIGDLSKWDVSNVKDISYMFYKCEKLKSIGDISDWDVSNVYSNVCMFRHSGITNRPSWYKG